MNEEKTVANPGDAYAWLIETSEGVARSHERDPARTAEGAGGIERSSSAEELARTVLARRFARLPGDEGYDWDELWFRATVWDVQACVDHAGWQQPPYPPERAQVEPSDYGRYLQVHRAEPHAVEVRVPRQVRAAVWQMSTASS